MSALGGDWSGYLFLVLMLAPFVQGTCFGVLKFLPKRHLGLISSACALVHLAIVVYLSLEVMGSAKPLRLNLTWFPEAYAHPTFRADGLALFFSLLITGMGVLISYYANYYMDHSEERIRRFYGYINIFMGAMLGAVLADNLLQLFVCWEITGVMSYFLINYHHESAEARDSARVAFLLNAFASLCLLLGIVLLAVLDGTLELSEIEQIGIVNERHPSWIFALIGLFLVGIFAKSAQFPMHFWLPDAMTAPTPVSAYLHSATMVKLGIYLIARIYILFVDSSLWFPLVSSLSLITVVLGGAFALFAHKLKQVLAYATVAQLGFFISFYGSGDPQGLQHDYVHIFNHALYKGSLFMLVGLLSHAAGITDIRQLSGVPKRLPYFTIVFVISVAAMAGVPGTTGFLSKELLVGDVVMLAKEDVRGMGVFAMLIAGLVFKVAFSYRLIYYLFLSKEEPVLGESHRPAARLLLPPLLLSALALLLGVWPKGLELLTQVYVVEGLHSSNPAELHLYHGFTLNLVISLAIFASGVLLFYGTHFWEPGYRSQAFPSLSALYLRWLDRLPHQARSLTSLVHRRRPEVKLGILFLAFCLLVGIPLLTQLPAGLVVDSFSLETLTKLLLAISPFIVLLLRRPFSRLIALSLVGFFLTFYFVLKEAPDVAMTQMVIEVAILLVIALLFFKVKPSAPPSHSLARALIAAAVGFSVALIPFFHGVEVGGVELGQFFVSQALPLAKGSNTVNTILVDFRALDTLGEIAVVVVAALGVAALLLKDGKLQVVQRPPLIPTPVLAPIITTLFLPACFYGIYLLLRGHNDPGGGFSGAMLPALFFVLVAMSSSKIRVLVLARINPYGLMLLGLALAVLSASLSLALDGEFMSAYYWQDQLLLSTPFLFDGGIFLLVLGAVVSLVEAMRQNSLGGIQG